MVNLSEDDILKWQKHFKEDWGVEYPPKETAEAARNLLGFFQALLEADCKQNPHLYKKKR